jgi:pyruvate/2-oxoglutarate dehydrogenase complex dihydrolipoamide acyltransferase (E2) component
MTSHHGRLSALAASVLAFFVAWAVIAAHPWSSVKAARDPRLVALAAREHRLRAEAGLVQQVVAARFADYRRRFAAYKAALAGQQAAARAAAARAAAAPAAAPSGGGGVRYVSLPPLVITRTS